MNIFLSTTFFVKMTFEIVEFFLNINLPVLINMLKEKMYYWYNFKGLSIDKMIQFCSLKLF